MRAAKNPQPPESFMTRLRVFFDGGCPACSKEIALYQRADRQQAIDWQDVAQASGSFSLPLPRETLLKRFHVQRPDGEMVSGARAFIEVWAALPGWRWLARLCRVPGMPSLLEVSYRIFLKLRPTLQKFQRRKSST
jgi:predicted DCC family thiol-disulfide oxidoreductase YuxK